MKSRAKKLEEERQAERLRLQRNREEARLARELRYLNRTQSSSSQNNQSDDSFHSTHETSRTDPTPTVDLNSPLNHLSNIFSFSFGTVHLHSPFEGFKNIFDFAFGTMATPIGHFDSKDPIFAALTSPQRRILDGILAAQVNHAKQLMKVMTFNASIEVPQWDSKKMTADTFIQKCKNYLSAQGHDEASHHTVLHMVMKGELKLWYENSMSRINSWATFTAAFKARFENEVIRMERSKTLNNRRQGPNDPCELFIYEIVNLTKQVDPLEPDRIALLRAKNALHPQIAALVPEAIDIDDLLMKVANAHDLLHRQSRIACGRNANIPPLNGSRDDSRNPNATQGNRGENSRGRSTHHNSYGTSFQNRGHFTQNNAYRRNNSEQSYGNRGNHNSQFGRGNGNNSNFQQNRSSYDNSNGSSRRQSFSNQGNFRGGQGSSSGNSNSNSSNDIKCRKCLKFGHIARDCRSRNGVSMMMPGSFKNNTHSQQSFYPNQHENTFNQHGQGNNTNPFESQFETPNPFHNNYNQPPNQNNFLHEQGPNNNLNSNGRNHGNSNRGYSRRQ
jgi:hypothetical protein